MNLHPSFVKDSHGRRTHVILPIEEWEVLSIPPVEPDEWDREALARIAKLSPEDLEPAPVTNPIRKARYEAGLSQAELARRMGITPGMLSRMEREGRRLREATIQRALAALKKDRRRKGKDTPGRRRNKE